MLALPPHTTHRLQPLDVGFFGPWKTFFSQACDKIMVSNPGRAITETKVGHLFEKAYSKAATVGNATKGLKACGIESFNDYIFSEEDFAASKVSERPIDKLKTKFKQVHHPANHSHHPVNQVHHPVNQVRHPVNQIHHPANQVRHLVNQVHHPVNRSVIQSTRSVIQSTRPTI